LHCIGGVFFSWKNAGLVAAASKQRLHRRSHRGDSFLRPFCGGISSQQPENGSQRRQAKKLFVFTRYFGKN
jgi:hypothetical protein